MRSVTSRHTPVGSTAQRREPRGDTWLRYAGCFGGSTTVSGLACLSKEGAASPRWAEVEAGGKAAGFDPSANQWVLTRQDAEGPRVLWFGMGGSQWIDGPTWLAVQRAESGTSGNIHQPGGVEAGIPGEFELELAGVAVSP